MGNALAEMSADCGWSLGAGFRAQTSITILQYDIDSNENCVSRGGCFGASKGLEVSEFALAIDISVYADSYELLELDRGR